MSEELKPCPFCGAPAEAYECQDGQWFVSCIENDCNGQIGYTDSFAAGVNRWNSRAELSALKAGQGEAVAYAQAWCAENEGTPAEFLAHSLLVKRSQVLGRKLTWRETIELTALTSSMPDAERDALLAMDDAPPATGVIVPRELLELAVSIPSKESIEVNEHGIIARGRAQAELRALLAQPQEVKS